VSSASFEQATVVGGVEADRCHVARLLREGGLALRSHPEPGALLVLLSQANDFARVREIRAAAQAHPDVCILAVMASDAANAVLRRALLAGAKGIIFENEVDRALVPTARAMLAGQLAVPFALGRQIAPKPLSHREKEIVALVMLGLTNRQIADKVFLAESTVKTHVSSAFRKLDVRSRAEAVARIQDPEAGYGTEILALTDVAIAGQTAV
jgi:DNA-binding NarL/FixJ family response regulator